MAYAIGYVAIDTPRIDEWVTLARDVLGMAVIDAGGGRYFGRMDDRAYRFDLRKADKEQARYGIEFASLEGIQEALQTKPLQGADHRWATAEECAHRKVKAAVLCQDPAGSHLELFYGQEQVLVVEPADRPTKGFVTGRAGMGHLVLGVPDLDATVDFYRDALGFRVSEFFDSKGIVFMQCNPREHSLALMRADKTKLIHMMLEVHELDDLGIAYDRSLERDLVSRTLGRHTNDRSISFYLTTPSGFEIEFGAGSVVVEEDEEWTVRSLAEPASVWGHERIKPSP